jgi:TP901 family phage tail tape measure protein
LNAMASQFTRAQVPIRAMGDAMRQTSSLLNYTMILPLAKLGTAAIQSARTFEVSMRKIQGLVGLSASEVNKFSIEIQKMAGETSRAPLELADAMYFITSAGLRGAEALSVLKQAAQSAAAGLGETRVVADAITSVINAYGAGNYSAAHAADVLTAAVKEGKVQADQIAPSLGKVLPIAAAYGATFEDVSAGMAALTRTGTTAGTSAIYLRQVMSQLLKPAKAAREELFSVGTSAEEVRKNVKEYGLLDALSMLNAKLGGTDATLATEGLTKVFGNVRALQAVLSLLGPNLEENRKIFGQVAMSAGDAAEATRVYQESSDFKFRQALANSQAALIGLGQSLMPIATGLMGMVSVLTGFASSLFRLGQGAGVLGKLVGGLVKFFGSLGFTLFIGAKAGLAIFRTWGSMVRLGGHLQTVIRGITQGIRLGGQSAQVSSAQFGGLTMTTEQEALAVDELNAAQASGNLTQRQALLIAAEYNGSLVERRFLAMAAAQADDQVAISTQAATVAIEEAALATEGFGATMMAVMPEIMMAGMLIATVASMFGVGPFGGDTSGINETTKKISELNDVLGGTVNLDKVEIGITYKVGETTAVGALGLTDEEKKNIEEKLSQDIIDATSNVAKNYGGTSSAAEFAAATIKRLGITGPDSAKVNEQLRQYFAEALGVDIPSIIQANTKFENIGNLPNDAGKMLAAEFVSGFSSKVEAKEYDKALADELGNMDLSQTSAVLDKLMAPTLNKDFLVGASQSITNVGNTINDSFGKTKNLTVFLAAYDEVIGAIKRSKSTPEITNEFFNDFNRGALSGITGLAKFKNEAAIVTGDLSKVFGDPVNTDATKKAFTTIFGDAKLATQITNELQTKLSGMSTATPIQQFEAFSNILKSHQVVSAAVTTEAERQQQAVVDLAATFDTGLNPDIQDLADNYEAATTAMKHFKDGQDAVYGITRNLTDAQIAAGDALRDVRSALAGASGNLDPFSEKGGAAISKIQKFADDAMAIANIDAVTPGKGLAVAMQDIQQMYTGLLSEMTKGGKMTQAEAQKTLNSIGINVGDLQKTLVGAGGVDEKGNIKESLLNQIALGINDSALEAANAASPGLKSFNDNLFAALKNYWGIKSPSKLAKDKIGGPIAEGIIQGLVTEGNIKTLEERMKYFGEKGAGGFATGMIQGMGASEKAIQTQADRWGAIAAAAAAAAKAAANPANISVSGTPAVTTGGSLGAIFGNLPGSSGAGTSSSGSSNKKIETKAEAKMQKVLDKLGNYSNAFGAMIDKITKDAKSSLEAIGGYINAQIKLSNTVVERQKLVIEQMALESEAAKAARDAAFTATKVGGNFGKDVTDYELSRIEELQLAYEEAARAYAMKRGTFTAMIDAEQALMEARASASEVSPDATKAATEVLDAQEKLKNKDLELAKATLDIIQAQQEQVTSAIELQVNMGQAREMFHQFAMESIPNTIQSIDQLGLSLSDPGGPFQIALHGLGETVFGYIKTAAQEATNASATKFIESPIITNPLDNVPKAPVMLPNGATPGSTFTPVGQPGITAKYGTPSQSLIDLFRQNPGAVRPEEIEKFQLWNYMAMGGIVTKATRAIIGENGPEAVIPLQGYGTQIALEKLFKAGGNESPNTPYGSGNNVYITVNNPVAETSEESIARRMKALSTAGLFR